MLPNEIPPLSLLRNNTFLPLANLDTYKNKNELWYFAKERQIHARSESLNAVTRKTMLQIPRGLIHGDGRHQVGACS